MGKILDDVSVLLVEDDPDTGELLALALTSRGANVTLTSTGEAAMSALSELRPDILILDIGLPDGDGLEWLGRIREVPGLHEVPAIALSGNARAVDRERSLAAGFEKHLCKPAQLADIVAAIAALVTVTPPHALNPMLARLSTLTGCRYTSFLRFEQDTVVSVWTYDREQPRMDPFPLELPIEASYCILVKRTGTPIAIENARCDPRAEGHPKQHALATYVAAPVFRADGVMFGTLCSYDAEPRSIAEHIRGALSDAARELERSLHARS